MHHLISHAKQTNVSHLLKKKNIIYSFKVAPSFQNLKYNFIYFEICCLTFYSCFKNEKKIGGHWTNFFINWGPKW